MASLTKAGYLQKHSNSFLSGGWGNVYVKLLKDSNMLFYKKDSDNSPKASVCLKDVSKWFAVGQYTNGMPDRPELPKSGNINNLIGIPAKPSSKSKVHWLLCANETEFNEWVSAIISTLPPIPAKTDHTPKATQPITPHVAPQQSMPPHATAPPHSSQYAPYSQSPYPPVQQPPPYNVGGRGPPPAGFMPMPVPQAYPAPPQHSAYPPQPYPPQSYQQAAPSHPYPAHQQYGSYPTAHAYPQAGYPQQGYQPYPVYQQGYAQQGYAQQGYPQHGAYAPQKKSSGFGGMGGKGNMIAGLAGGALLGYGASRMMGGGFGLGRWGSWSSLSSFGSVGSCGSFGSFG